MPVEESAELDKGNDGYNGKRVRTMRPRFRLTPKNSAIAIVAIVVMTLALLQLAPVRHQVQAGIARVKLSMVTRKNTDEDGMQSLITEGYQALHDGNIPVAKMYYTTVFALTDRTANSVARADAACGNIAATIERYRNDEKKLFQFQFETLLQLIAETEKIPKEKRPEKFAGRLAFRAWKLEQSMPSAFQPSPAQLEQLVAPLLAVGANNRAGEILGEAGRRYAWKATKQKPKSVSIVLCNWQRRNRIGTAHFQRAFCE